MGKRHLHYEAAVEDYLRNRGVAYVSVNEARRAIFTDVTLKSFDFLVYTSTNGNLLVDVKGRKLSGTGRGRSQLQNWATQEDLDDLAEWERVFGSGFHGVLVFTYWITQDLQSELFSSTYAFGNRRYGIQVVSARDYAHSARPRSARWATVSIPSEDFTRITRPIEYWLG